MLLPAELTCIAKCLLGLLKKLELLSKRRGMQQVSLWIRSIVYHLYWVAATSDGNGPLALAKWKSLTRHLANLHDAHDDPLFTECLHPPLEAGAKPWFDPGMFWFRSV